MQTGEVKGGISDYVFLSFVKKCENTASQADIMLIFEKKYGNL